MQPANTTIPFFSIKVSDRMRKDLGDIDELASSIEELGLICPICVEENGNGTYSLLAGGRRYTAWNKLYAQNEIKWYNIPVYIRYNLTAETRGLVELEENIRRKKMTWQEECLGIAQVHEAHKNLAARDGSKWTMIMTGGLLGDMKHASVVNATILAKHLIAGDEEITKAENPNQAQQILYRRKQAELEAKQALLKKAALAARTVKREVVEQLLDQDATEEKITVFAEAAMNTDLSDATLDAYEKACGIIQHRDSHELMAQMMRDGAMVDGIYTDIPYGIALENLDLKNIDETAAEHDKDANIELFSSFLHLAMQVTKPQAFCVFWFDVEHTTTIETLAKSFGWIPQRWPLHAKKPIASNGAAGYNTTKDYESVMVLRKENTTLVNRCSTSFIPWQWEPGEKEQFLHPFCKPHSANAHLLSTFFQPGASLLDPYCGEGSLVLSGLKLGYQMTGIDLKETHVNRARSHVEKLLKA